jgi:hypothetical protein
LTALHWDGLLRNFQPNLLVLHVSFLRPLQQILMNNGQHFRHL